MKIAVVGGTGFIGNSLIPYLSKIKEHDVLCISRTEPGYSTDSLLVKDILDLSYENFQGFDVLVHLAGCAHSLFSEKDYEKVNHLATINLAEQAIKAGVKRFIFVSTVSVYGEVGTFECNSATAPCSLAAKTKLAAENSLKELCAKSGMEFIIIRSPLVYGEGVKANFASLINFVGKGFPLPFRLIKRNKRSLVSVYNLVDLIKVCIEHPKAANQMFLASDDHDISTAEMVALMAKVQNKMNLSLPVPVWLFKLAGKIFNKSDVIDRLTGSLQLDLEHTKNTLNWKPPYSVEHGFKLSVKNTQDK